MHRLTMSYFYNESDKRFQDIFERYISVASSINIPNLSFGFYRKGNSMNFVFERLNQISTKASRFYAARLSDLIKFIMKSTRLF